jgi:hypothetical protein
VDHQQPVADVFVAGPSSNRWQGRRPGKSIRGFVLGMKGLTAPRSKADELRAITYWQIVMDGVFVPEEACCPTSAA